MEVAVVGGTGVCGALVVKEVRRRGHVARVLARRPGPAGFAVDLTTGEGLAAALEGVEVVIDAANSTKPRQMRDVLVAGTERLMRAETAAGVRHHVLISIIGIDDTPWSYYQLKVAQEQAVADSAVPSTIVRATQFHDLLHRAFSTFARFGVAPRSNIRLQPIDPTPVASALVDAAERTPGGHTELAGPEIHTVTELAAQWATATRTHRLPLPMWLPSKLSRPLVAGSLTSPDAPRASVTFSEWMGRETERAAGE